MKEGQLNFGANKFFANIADGQSCVYAEKGGKLLNVLILIAAASTVPSTYIKNAALFNSFFITHKLRLLPSGQFLID